MSSASSCDCHVECEVFHSSESPDERTASLKAVDVLISTCQPREHGARSLFIFLRSSSNFLPSEFNDVPPDATYLKTGWVAVPCFLYWDLGVCGCFGILFVRLSSWSECFCTTWRKKLDAYDPCESSSIRDTFLWCSVPRRWPSYLMHAFALVFVAESLRAKNNCRLSNWESCSWWWWDQRNCMSLHLCFDRCPEAGN